MDAYSFVENMLERRDISRQAASEALIVFESLMQKLVDWGLDENTDLNISGVNKLGDLSIRIAFEGRMFTPYADGADSLEDKILKGHDDKLDFSYRTGYNAITISVRRAMHKSLPACVVATLLAFICYAYIRATMDTPAQMELLDGYIFPLEKLYTNAALMVGAPMTFFSLLYNLTSAYITAQRDSSIRRMQIRTFGTSVLAIFLALVATFTTFLLFANAHSITAEFTLPIDRSFAEIVTELIPPSIFEPFEAISPVPLMVVALLGTYAMCSAGKHFDFLNQALMACYTIFSRMLHVVIAVLPFFCFFAVLDMLIESGARTVLELLGYCIALGVSVVFYTCVAIYYNTALLAIYVGLFTALNLYLMFRTLETLALQLPRPVISEVADVPEESKEKELEDFNEANLHRFQRINFWMQNHREEWKDSTFGRDRLCQVGVGVVVFDLGIWKALLRYGVKRAARLHANPLAIQLL